jgi:hypothetical protein
LPAYSDYKPLDFNTSFTYSLIDSVAERVANDGIDDLCRCVPFTMICTPEILSIDLPMRGRTYTRAQSSELRKSAITLEAICARTAEGGQADDDFCIASLSKQFTRVLVPVRIRGNGVHLEPIESTTPRLFCDFPLVGTEIFPFPAIINNPHFDPTDPRDGVLLNGELRTNPLVENNRKILSDAVELFVQLVQQAVAEEWQNLHCLANISRLRHSTDWITTKWFDENILTPIRKTLLHANIVQTEAGSSPVAMVSSDNSRRVWFPSAATKEMRARIWELASHWIPRVLPRKDDVELWHELIWDQCAHLTIDKIAETVEGYASLAKLKEQLGEKDCIEWLNAFYDMILEDEKGRDTIINNRAIFPNQHGNFCKLDVINGDKGDIELEFKEILELLGFDIRKELADANAECPIPSSRTLGQQFAVEKISALALTKSNNRVSAKECRPAFSRILIWFKANPKLAAELFPALYSQKHVLYDDESVVENIEKAEQLDSLFTEGDVTSIEELRQLIRRGKSQILPLTQEILVSLGISSVEDWTKALEDKDLAAMFSHEPVPTQAMFFFAMDHIRRAKDNIFEHLRTHPNYDLSDAEWTAPTVLGGVKKDSREIQIVARPAYSREVIIYYSAERDVLDFEDSELWVDTGDSRLRITLGHILKTTDIKKFPI